MMHPLHAKSSSDRLHWSSLSRPRKKQYGWPTIPNSDWGPLCGVRTRRVRMLLRRRLRRARSSSMTLFDRIPVHRLAGSRDLVWVENWARWAPENSRTPSSSGSRCESISLISVDEFYGDTSDGVGIHVVVLAGVFLAYVSPGSGLPYVITELLVVGNCLVQIVHRHAQMLNALFVQLKEIGINVR